MLGGIYGFCVLTGCSHKTGGIRRLAYRHILDYSEEVFQIMEMSWRDPGFGVCVVVCALMVIHHMNVNRCCAGLQTGGIVVSFHDVISRVGVLVITYFIV